MSTYSDHTHLEKLYGKVNEYTCSFTDRVFTPGGATGGVNDLTLSGIITALFPVDFRIEIEPGGTTFQWSDDGGSTWKSRNLDLEVFAGETAIELAHGVAALFTPVNPNLRNPGDRWDFTARGPNSSVERAMAYDWVNDRLRGTLSMPISDPSDSVIFAEANYAIFLILRAQDDPAYNDFRLEANRLISSIKKEDLGISKRGGPIANSAEVCPEFTRTKYDYDGNVLGRAMGRFDGVKGSLEDW
jgi:hypothetical protein